MTQRQVLTIVIVCMTVFGLAFAAYQLHNQSSEHAVIDVEGGAIIEETKDSLVIRCLSTDVTIATSDFAGKVTLRNCFPGSVLEGYDGDTSWNGTELSFDVLDSRIALHLIAPQKDRYSFAVMSDSQGHNDILEEALNMTSGCDFVIHCGDLTPSGSVSEFAAVGSTLDKSVSPVFTTPGNHDTKDNGSSGYTSTFGPAQYAFDYGGVRFAFVDSSNLDISVGQISSLERVLAGADRKVIVTHGPTFDPFEGNHTLDSSSCERLQQFALENGVTAVFSGHVHAYCQLKVENTDFVITGGAGGSLTNGTYHWLKVNVTTSAFAYEKIDIDHLPTSPSALTLRGHGLTKNLTIEELGAMKQLQGDSSYENQFGNVGGAGHYKGVPVSALVAFVGNISEGEILRITATDGYYQEFGYGNVNPNSTWFELQGPIIVSLEYDGAQMPAWIDGPRIAMLPSDGLYSNSDCSQTSYPGQGYATYPSAGARWVKNVAVIEVIS